MPKAGALTGIVILKYPSECFTSGSVSELLRFKLREQREPKEVILISGNDHFHRVDLQGTHSVEVLVPIPSLNALLSFEVLL